MTGGRINSSRGQGGRLGGFTAIEILVSISILALAFVPVLTMLSSGTRESYYSEYHLLAQTRAETILQLLSTRDLQALMTGPVGTAVSVAISPEDLKLDLPPSYEARLPAFQQSVTLTPLARGLAEVVVEIDWAMPVEQAGAEHHFLIRRIISHPTLGLESRYIPRQEVGP